VKRRGQKPLAALRGMGLSIAGAIAMLCLAIAAVWPLWFLATKYTKLYSILAVGALAIWLLFSVARRIIKAKKRPSRPASVMPADSP